MSPSCPVPKADRKMVQTSRRCEVPEGAGGSVKVDMKTDRVWNSPTTGSVHWASSSPIRSDSNQLIIKIVFVYLYETLLYIPLCGAVILQYKGPSNGLTKQICAALLIVCCCTDCTYLCLCCCLVGLFVFVCVVLCNFYICGRIEVTKPISSQYGPRLKHSPN